MWKSNADILNELKHFELEQQLKKQKELLEQNIPFWLQRKVEYKINKLIKLLKVL